MYKIMQTHFAESKYTYTHTQILVHVFFLPMQVHAGIFI